MLGCLVVLGNNKFTYTVLSALTERLLILFLNRNPSFAPTDTHQQDALPGHPANGQDGPALDPVVVSSVQVSAHAEVGDLYCVVLTHEAIARGQIAVDKVERGQVLHARGDLHGHPNQFTVAEGRGDHRQ